jgi:CRISPR-associated exonuclease Cas4
MFSENDLLPLSALQHLLFCERQCALIHVERLWAENRLTVEGKQLHEKAHEGPDDRRGGLYTLRGLPLRSLELGLIGVADVVEVEAPAPAAAAPPAKERLFELLKGESGRGWRITPVEYKRGVPKKDDSDRVQLCAQAICLEEMLDTKIPGGALFYGTRRRRTEVDFDSTLRELVAVSARRLHELLSAGRTPPGRKQAKCDQCSLAELCLPGLPTRRTSASAFTEEAFREHLASAGPDSDPFDFSPPDEGDRP